MSITHLSLVNQKLAYASASISMLDKLQTESGSRQKLEQQALGDAAVFHLVMALSFYVREIAERHSLQGLSTITSIQELSAALAKVDRVSSDASELLDLHKKNDSWLSQMQDCYALLSKSPDKPKDKKAFTQNNLIDVLEVSGDSMLALTPDLLVSWLNDFRALVARQRETSAEY